MKTARGLLTFVLILLLTGLVIREYATDRFKKDAVDFYNFWAVPTAQRLSGYTLGSPYRAIPQYGDFLKNYLAVVPDDLGLLRVTDFWYGHPEIRQVSRNNSPLLYTVFGIFPEQYSFAASLFRWSEAALFVTAVLIWTTLLGIRSSYGVAGSLALLLVLYPAHRDLEVGNINAFLVFGLVGLLAVNRLRARAPFWRSTLSGILASGVALLILLKPLVLLPCLFLAAFVGVKTSLRDKVVAISAGIAAVLAGMLGSIWFFRSWTVWRDWLHAVRGDEGILYPSRGQNCSLVMLLAERTQAKPMFVTLAIGALLILSLLIALSRRDRRFPAKPLGIQSVMGHARSVFSDAGLMVSIGIIFTLALSPLVWIHYYMLAIIPALWLCAPAARPRIGLLLAAIFVAASSGPLISMARLTHTLQWYFLAQTLSWIPLWVGILIAVGSYVQPHRAASEH